MQNAINFINGLAFQDCQCVVLDADVIEYLFKSDFDQIVATADLTDTQTYGAVGSGADNEVDWVDTGKFLVVSPNADVVKKDLNGYLDIAGNNYDTGISLDSLTHTEGKAIKALFNPTASSRVMIGTGDSATDLTVATGSHDCAVFYDGVVRVALNGRSFETEVVSGGTSPITYTMSEDMNVFMRMFDSRGIHVFLKNTTDFPSWTFIGLYRSDSDLATVYPVVSEGIAQHYLKTFELIDTITDDPFTGVVASHEFDGISGTDVNGQTTDVGSKTITASRASTLLEDGAGYFRKTVTSGNLVAHATIESDTTDYYARQISRSNSASGTDYVVNTFQARYTGEFAGYSCLAHRASGTSYLTIQLLNGSTNPVQSRVTMGATHHVLSQDLTCEIWVEGDTIVYSVEGSGVCKADTCSVANTEKTVGYGSGYNATFTPANLVKSIELGSIDTAYGDYLDGL